MLNQIEPNTDASDRAEMPIFVINLERSTDRLNHVARQLADQAIHFERIPAVDGAAMPVEAMAAFVAARPRPGGLVWKPGQVGCLLSHTEAWRRLVQTGASHALVLEDDIRVSRDLKEFATNRNWIPADADIVRIETTGQWLKLAEKRPTVGGRHLAKVASAAWATGGYVISRDAAARLLETDPRTHMPVDAFLFDVIRSQVARKLRTIQVFPALVTQDKFDTAPGSGLLFESEIETDNVRRDQHWQRLRRQITSRLAGKTEILFR